MRTKPEWSRKLKFRNNLYADKDKKSTDRPKIVENKKYGQHILIEDSTGSRYSTKNIAPIGCRTLFDGDYIHGKEKKADITLDYEL